MAYARVRLSCLPATKEKTVESVSCSYDAYYFLKQIQMTCVYELLSGTSLITVSFYLPFKSLNVEGAGKKEVVT